MTSKEIFQKVFGSNKKMKLNVSSSGRYSADLTASPVVEIINSEICEVRA